MPAHAALRRGRRVVAPGAVGSRQIMRRSATWVPWRRDAAQRAQHQPPHRHSTGPSASLSLIHI
eukprot:531446-Rhodomonas_salina.2